MNNTRAVDRASRIEVAASAAASIEVSAGAALQCIAGKLWLTQEGDARDHVVPAGTTFCTDRGGRVVMSAIGGASVVLVRKAAPRHCVPGTVTIDSLERFTHTARAAQAEYVAALCARLAGWLRARVGSKAVRVSTGPARTDAFRGYVRSL